jgi:hypothetical protein
VRWRSPCGADAYRNSDNVHFRPKINVDLNHICATSGVEKLKNVMAVTEARWPVLANQAASKARAGTRIDLPGDGHDKESQAFGPIYAGQP